MNRRHCLAFPLFFVLLAPFGRLEAGILGVNLITNGDAEIGLGSPTGDVVAVPGWTVVGNLTAVTYGAGGGFPILTDPGPVLRGANFLAGGPSNAASSASQVIDVSAEAVAIDAGRVSFALDAFLGGFSSQRDNAVLRLDFLGATNSRLGFATLGPVSSAERGNRTGLLSRSAGGDVPLGTRMIDVTLSMTRVDGFYNDGYADNLSLVLTSASGSAPEPSGVALLCLGAAVVGMTRRRPLLWKRATYETTDQVPGIAADGRVNGF